MWLRWLGRRVKEITKAAPPSAQMVLIEFVCTTDGCEFETLSLTDAQKHIQETLMFGGGVSATTNHNIEPRGYYYPKEPL